MEKRITGRVGLWIAAFLLAAWPAWAAAPADVKPKAGAFPAGLFEPDAPAPDISGIPMFTRLTEAGAKLHYMGTRSGLPGWLVVKSGQIQMLYLSPDKKTVILGGLFTPEGGGVTGHQIEHLASRNAEVQAIVGGASQQQSAIARAGLVEEGIAAVPGGGAELRRSAISDIPAVALSPGERLIQDMQAGAGVVLGNNQNAELYMVVAPGCPNCKRTWLELENAVRANKIQLRLLPVYNSTGGVERDQAARLLRAKDPLESWARFAAGDVAALSEGPVEPTAIKGVMANLNLVTKWKIQGYPYFVYRAKDGRVKIVQGKPERMAAVLLDLIP